MDIPSNAAGNRSKTFACVAALAVVAVVLLPSLIEEAQSMTSDVSISGNQVHSEAYSLDIYSDTEGAALSGGKTLFTDAKIYYKTSGGTVYVSSAKENIGTNPNHELSAVQDRYLMMPAGHSGMAVYVQCKIDTSGTYAILDSSDAPAYIKQVDVVLTYSGTSYTATVYGGGSVPSDGRVLFDGLSMVQGAYYEISVKITLQDFPSGTDWNKTAPSFAFTFTAEAS